MSFDKKAAIESTGLKGPKKAIKRSISGDPASIFRTGKTQKKISQEKQSLLIEKQRQKEEIKLAESDDELARRKALATGKKAGRRSLIQTGGSGAGLATTLGG